MTEAEKPNVRDITFVTSNQAKVAEVETILGFSIKVLVAKLPEIQDELEAIAIQKAKDAFDRVGSPK